VQVSGYNGPMVQVVFSGLTPDGNVDNLGRRSGEKLSLTLHPGENRTPDLRGSADLEFIYDRLGNRASNLCRLSLLDALRSPVNAFFFVKKKKH
jgi:hypothetical protein